MAKTELTLREVTDEAQRYGLSPDYYDSLKETFERRQRERLLTEVTIQVKKEAKAELRGEVTSELRPGLRIEVEKELRPKLATEIEKELRAKLPDELRPKLREELLPEVRKQVEAELGDNLRQEARTAVEQEIAKQIPTHKDRNAFREFVREEEVDCMTQANAASTDADTAESSLLWGRRLRVPFAYGLFVALPVLAFVLYQRFDLQPGFWAFLVPAVFAAIVFAATLSDRQERFSKRVVENRKIASDYWVLAEQAKKLRIITSDYAQTRGELQQELAQFTAAKRQLDDHYYPAAKSLELSRTEVRNRLMSDVDPDKLLRIATDPDPEEPEIEEPLAQKRA